MRAPLAAMAITVVLALGGCAPASHDQSDAVSAQLEQTVLAVTDAIAAQDWSVAERDLAVLEGQVEAAAAAGTLTAERADGIREAIALVRGDVIEALDEESVEPAPEPPPQDAPGNSGGNNGGNNGGNGNGSGNGNGNGDKKP